MYLWNIRLHNKYSSINTQKKKKKKTCFVENEFTQLIMTYTYTVERK